VDGAADGELTEKDLETASGGNILQEAESRLRYAQGWLAVKAMQAFEAINGPIT
jgi:hypothetical protein